MLPVTPTLHVHRNFDFGSLADLTDEAAFPLSGYPSEQEIYLPDPVVKDRFGSPVFLQSPGIGSLLLEGAPIPLTEKHLPKPKRAHSLTEFYSLVAAGRPARARLLEGGLLSTGNYIVPSSGGFLDKRPELIYELEYDGIPLLRKHRKIRYLEEIKLRREHSIIDDLPLSYSEILLPKTLPRSLFNQVRRTIKHLIGVLGVGLDYAAPRDSKEGRPWNGIQVKLHPVGPLDPSPNRRIGYYGQLVQRLVWEIKLPRKNREKIVLKGLDGLVSGVIIKE